MPNHTSSSRLDFSLLEADVIYDELGTLCVELDADPLSFGPKRLNNKVAEVRKALDRCERIFLDVSQQLHTVKHQRRKLETALELVKKQLFANDPEVRAGRSVSDREAIATGKLQTEVEKLHILELAEQDLDAVLSVVKAKRTDLRDTAGRLRDQMRLCQEEITLNQTWGSALPNAPALPDNPLGTSSDEIDEMLADVVGGEGVTNLGPAQDEEPETAVQRGTIPGFELEEEFGFVPHCEKCGEPQFRVIGHGMTCKNGHGGADSVPEVREKSAEPEDESQGAEEFNIEDLLPKPGEEEPQGAEDFDIEDLFPKPSQDEAGVDEALPATVTTEAADEYLSAQDPENTEEPATDEDDSLDDLALDNILGSFESNE